MPESVSPDFTVWVVGFAEALVEEEELLEEELLDAELVDEELVDAELVEEEELPAETLSFWPTWMALALLMLFQLINWETVVW